MMGDLTTSLGFDPPYADSVDPRRQGSEYADNHILQQLLRN